MHFTNFISTSFAANIGAAKPAAAAAAAAAVAVAASPAAAAAATFFFFFVGTWCNEHFFKYLFWHALFDW